MRERRMDKEQIEILLEAEERNEKITVISPQLKARYNEWSSKKPDTWDGMERTTTDVVVELPVWGVLCYVGMMGGIEALDGITGVGVVRMVLTVILHVVCAGFLFTMGFSSLQGVESRRSGTLDTTKWFGCLVVSAVIGITSLFSAICCSSYTGAERYYMHVLRTHNYLPNPEAVPQYGDTYAWGNMAAKRHEKYLRWTCIAGALVYYALTLLIKSNSEASVNLGAVANGFVERARQRTLSMAGQKKSLKQKLGICIGKGTLNKPKNLPGLEHTVINKKEKGKDKDKEQTKEERRKVLQEKLKQRRKSTAT